MSRWFRLGLSLLVALPLWATGPLPGAAAPTMHDMAACCRKMQGHCPKTPAGQSCCQQQMRAPAPVWLHSVAPATVPAARARRNVPAQAIPQGTEFSASVPGLPPPPLFALRI